MTNTELIKSLSQFAPNTEIRINGYSDSLKVEKFYLNKEAEHLLLHMVTEKDYSNPQYDE